MAATMTCFVALVRWLRQRGQGRQDSPWRGGDVAGSSALGAATAATTLAVGQWGGPFMPCPGPRQPARYSRDDCGQNKCRRTDEQRHVTLPRSHDPEPEIREHAGTKRRRTIGGSPLTCIAMGNLRIR